GLVSCAEWTGVKLSTLFNEVGIDPKTKWFVAEGADAPTMHRSIPVSEAMDDAMIALYQNGERINPSNGYPMRLLLPGLRRRPQAQGARHLREFRRCLCGHRADRQSHGVGRRRQELGGGGPSGAAAPQGLHPVPYAVALGRRPRDLAEPRLGRGGQ